MVFVPPDLVPKQGFFNGNWANAIVMHIHILNVTKDTIFTVIINTLDRLSLITNHEVGVLTPVLALKRGNCMLKWDQMRY